MHQLLEIAEPARRADPARARVTSRKGAGGPHDLPRTSRCRRRAATLSNRRNGRAEHADSRPRCLSPRPARRPPRLRVTIPPLTVTAPGAARASRSPRARTRGGTQRLPARPAAPRSLQPLRPASRRLPRRTLIPPRPALAPPIGSAGCQATNNRDPNWSGEDRAPKTPEPTPSRSPQRSCGHRTCYARPGSPGRRSPPPALRGGRGRVPAALETGLPGPLNPNAPQGAKVGLPGESGALARMERTPTDGHPKLDPTWTRSSLLNLFACCGLSPPTRL
ncbi:uncharacterized protein LOC143274069 [Peromyscus maniculatus bairdii]|uniref:uncharacterized protein LOC143274069 n=1 Tax=Peromyscus maniculatus bairdii TaxID=230844 RepID=UPI003FD18742